MIPKPQDIKKSLNSAYRRAKPKREDIESFKINLKKLLDNIDEKESEENVKNHLMDCLKDTWYKSANFLVAPRGKTDFVIHIGKDAKEPSGILFEVKRPVNKADMVTKSNLNKKAMHELLLYYLQERIGNKSQDIRNLVITNIYEWFIFDAHEFERLFYKNGKLTKNFKEWQAGQKASHNTDFFYSEIAAPAIAEITSEITFTYFDIRDYEKELLNDDKSDDNKLIPLFKVLSPSHLLKLPSENDSNTLDKGFYAELLHIIGLEEVKEKGKKVIKRKAKANRNPASLIEDTIEKLDVDGNYSKVPNLSSYGSKKDDWLFGIALELCITWINRILFLKLLEAQLNKYHKSDKPYKFLNCKHIGDFDVLYRLFFQVLAIKPQERTPAIQEKFGSIPYLNSSLFEQTELERTTVRINGLDNNLELNLYSGTVLRKDKNKPKASKLKTLEYLFDFLDAYDFASESDEEIQEENKTLINASILGLIFEKINGYKDGSFFTPSYITMYMCSETIRAAVLQKFQDEYPDAKFDSFVDLKNYISDRRSTKETLHFNSIINSLKICDPAVGSGHFLVSALNEIIAIKAELGLLVNDKGERISDYEFHIDNDELIATHKDTQNIFEYKVINGKPSKEAHNIQKTLFHEKQLIIENCLFGVDINPNSVKICRLRLWIELLKNAYYTEESGFKELETLPNIDINIKTGNSLLSRFGIDASIASAFKGKKVSINEYKNFVADYKNTKSREKKSELEKAIEEVKKDIKQDLHERHPVIITLRRRQTELELSLHKDLFELSKKEEKAKATKQQELKKEISKLELQADEIKNNKIYQNAFEWRFEFPEILDNDGNFKGFDVVIGNPPYIKEYDKKSAFDGLRGLECYQGKMDIWYLFAALGLDILKANYYQSYIAPNNWITNFGASKIREKLIKQSTIHRFVDFSNYKVFDSASIQTMIYLIQKNKPKKSYPIKYSKLLDDSVSANFAANFLAAPINSAKSEAYNFEFKKDDYNNELITFFPQKEGSVLKKIKDRAIDYLAEKEITQGIVLPQENVIPKHLETLSSLTVGDGIFLLSDEEKNHLNWNSEELDIIKPYYTSSEIGRYNKLNVNKLWLIYTKSDANSKISNYPNIKKHLDNFSEIITSDNKPYGLHRAREEDFFVGEKIISLRKCHKPTFTYTDFDCYVSQTFFSIKTQRFDMKFLTGLLNSKLIAFWLKYKGKMQGDLYQVDKEPLTQIPICTEKGISDKISKLVSNIIDARKTNTLADISALEVEIDQLVYKLYGLSNDDVKIIEDSMNG